MRYSLNAQAKEHLLEIWYYTARQWGKPQANDYIRAFYEKATMIFEEPSCWREVEYRGLQGLYYFQYEKHLGFFRQLSSSTILVISVYHHRMNWPTRLKKALSRPTK